MNSPGNHSNPGSIPCAAIEILLAEFEAGELDQAEANLVSAHLEICAECRAELAREKFLRGTLSDLPLVACPQRVTENILATVGSRPESAEPKPRPRRLNPILGWAAAAAAVVLVMTSPLVKDRPSSPEFTPQEIQTARQDAQRGLLMAVRVLNQTERSTVKEVFGQTLPESLSRSIKTIINTPEGGQG